MRARNIKPGFFKNEDIAECSPFARLCFAGLWMLADRDGRLEDRPKRIKGELFAFDTVEVEPLLQELARFGFIIRYETDGMKAIQIREFAKHQSPHYSENPSVIKPPELQEAVVDKGHVKPENSGSTTGNLRKDGVIKGGSQPPDSLIPDSLIPEVKTSRSRNPSVTGLNGAFSDFWERYPRKQAKGAAEKAWLSIRPDQALCKRIITAVEQAKSSEQWQRDGGQYIPHPATWLRSKRWEDQPMQAHDPDRNPDGSLRLVI